ncbi:Structural maintenance of chromosomes protein 6 [Fusarium torreyae]|uniref:Structural maintenance of chromosomes protein 6 n=1 Tax=Fusarium torreyae TaxID=1237075 RepID=A0A9W8VB13_9HYPO|nr:Structural maintenance of chromosomes protein 6 [Fusarium torreyae]
MAPAKRSRRDADQDDDDSVDVQQARSNFRGEDSRKRARVTLDDNRAIEPTPQRESTPSSESEDDEERQYNNTPPQTQYELMRDNGFRHLQHTDWDDQQATQKLAQRGTTLGNNMVSESGIIESITCFNFMCHERLHVELGPLINFIVGENGSGKSAVLTALTLCLGGKASDTNRGGSLKSFVKEGCDQGSLLVKIKNAGSDAYQPDIYGESIVVERHFSKSGSSGFKIKSATGRIISTKKQEVDEISEWYALQIGNPLTVLSQDNARQFLNAATPAQKYKYFVSGVQLEQLDNDYKMSQDTLDKTLILREDLTSKIEEVKKEMEEARRLAETAQKNQTLREKARHYINQLVWSQVVEQERLLADREADLVRRAEAITEAEEYRDKTTAELEKVEEKLERVRQAKNELEQDWESYDNRIARATAAHQQATKAENDLLLEERDAYQRLKTVKDDMKACQRKIEEEERRLGESTGNVRTQKDNELEHARRKEQLLKEHMEETQNNLPQLQSRLGEAEQHSKKLSQSKELKRKEVVSVEHQVRELKATTGGRFDGYDKEIKDLVTAIEKDNGWDQRPVGPIGAHIRLSKPEWSGILERTLGDGLNAFVVRSKSDQSKLSNMMRRFRLRKQPPIYIAYGGRIDTSSQEPGPEFDTILRVLQFDDDIVRSQLIISNQIEKIVLIRDRVEAERVMVEGVPPRNVAACLCFHDGRGKRGWGLRLTNRNGSIGTSPIQPNIMRPRMLTDSAQQVEIQEENLKHLGQEMAEITRDERQAQQAVQRCRSELENQRKDTKRYEGDLRRTQADIERVQMELDAFEGVDDRLNILRAELESKRLEEEQYGSQYGTMGLEKRDLKEKTEKARLKLEHEKNERDDFQSKVNKAFEKIASVENMRRVTLAKKNDAFEGVDIAKNERRRAEEKRDQKAAEVADFTEQASRTAPERVHIPDEETHSSIEQKYTKIREQLKQREARLGATDQQIYDRATEARERYEDVMRQTRDVDDTISSLKRAIEHRLHLWRQFQRQISARIRIQFNYLLSERGFRGKIDLDHRARKVVLQIEPDETRKSSAGRNTKTLSGGEKSFSSICMLLSIWEAIGSPIRCLDEFDVFMDNVNRAISTNMLVDAARRSVSRQYILITPNAIEGRARLAKDVQVIRLTDPRQRTLDSFQ